MERNVLRNYIEPQDRFVLVASQFSFERHGVSFADSKSGLIEENEEKPCQPPTLERTGLKSLRLNHSSTLIYFFLIGSLDERYLVQSSSHLSNSLVARFYCIYLKCLK